MRLHIKLRTVNSKDVINSLLATKHKGNTLYIFRGLTVVSRSTTRNVCALQAAACSLASPLVAPLHSGPCRPDSYTRTTGAN